MRPASDAEQRRLNELFAELCAIPSPLGHEAACARRVREELESLGLHVEEDGAAAEAGAECGNLVARIPGRMPRRSCCARTWTPCTSTARRSSPCSSTTAGRAR